ncbi:MAG: sensor histidine kinase [Deltaproteobacteria bacterium]|nr:sensor histidine kinase [Deltaproteobacteria bacterium]
MLLAWAFTLQAAPPAAPAESLPPPVVLTAETKAYHLDLSAEMLEDPQGTLTLQDVRSPALQPRWVRPPHGAINLGLSASVLWVRVRVVNRSAETTWEMGTGQQWLREISLYQLTGNTVAGPWEAGLTAPLESRSIPDRASRYRLTLPTGQEQTFYIRAKGVGNMGLDLSLAHISQAFHSDYVEKLVVGVYSGMVMAMLVYNLFMGLALRDRRYLFYLMYLFSMALFILLLYGVGQTLWPDNFSPGDVEFLGWSLLYVGLVLVISLTLFTGFFFKAWSDRNVGTVLKIWLGLTVATMAASPWLGLIWGYQVFDGLLVLSQLVVGYSALVYLWRGDRPARFFAAALLPELMGVSINGLAFANLAPMNWFTLNAGLLSAGAEVLIFSLALASRYNQMRQEKEQSVKQALDMQVNLVRRLEENEELKTEIARRVKVEQELRDTTALKDKFVTLVAHDIRSPFSAIMTQLEFALQDREFPLPPKHQESFSGMYEKMRSLITMVGNLLNLNRLQTGQIVPQREQFDGWELAEEVMLFNHLARQKGIQLEQQVPQETWLWGDRNLIREVVQNLVVNAIKFTHSGGRVRMYVPPGTGCRLAVEDTGVGVRPEFLAKLFDPGEKTTSPGTAGERGSGIGLPLCQEIMAAHGGDITVESSPNQGSRFVLAWPGKP